MILCFLCNSILPFLSYLNFFAFHTIFALMHNFFSLWKNLWVNKLLYLNVWLACYDFEFWRSYLLAIIDLWFLLKNKKDSISFSFPSTIDRLWKENVNQKVSVICSIWGCRTLKASCHFGVFPINLIMIALALVNSVWHLFFWKKKMFDFQWQVKLSASF